MKTFIIVLLGIVVGMGAASGKITPRRNRITPAPAILFAPTKTPIPTETAYPPTIEPTCDMAYPNPYLPDTCAHATMESQLATWTAANCAAGDWVDGVLNCVATVEPTPNWNATLTAMPTRPFPGVTPYPGPTSAYP